MPDLLNVIREEKFTNAVQINVRFLDKPGLATVHIQNVPEIEGETEIEGDHPGFIADQTVALLRPDGMPLSFENGQSHLKCVMVGPLCEHTVGTRCGTSNTSSCSKTLPRVYTVNGVQPASGEFKFWLEEQKYRNLNELHARNGHLRILESGWAC